VLEDSVVAASFGVVAEESGPIVLVTGTRVSGDLLSTVGGTVDREHRFRTD
jgi:hypothetical protein